MAIFSIPARISLLLIWCVRVCYVVFIHIQCSLSCWTTSNGNELICFQENINRYADSLRCFARVSRRACVCMHQVLALMRITCAVRCQKKRVLRPVNIRHSSSTDVCCWLWISTFFFPIQIEMKMKKWICFKNRVWLRVFSIQKLLCLFHQSANKIERWIRLNAN